MSSFFEWFDPVSAAAKASPLGIVMTADGFDVTHTGGRCLAWERKLEAGWAILLTDEEAGLGTDLAAEDFGVMICGPDGEYINGPSGTNLDECTAWARQFDTNAAMLGLSICYSGDNEGPAIMPLHELFENFEQSGGWQFRHNPTDCLLELASRGWYEGLHENGRYIVLNYAKLGLAKPADAPAVEDEPI